MSRRLRLTVPTWAALLLCHAVGVKGLRQWTPPSAQAAETSRTRKQIRCILANTTHHLGKIFQRWPSGEEVAWPRTNGSCAVVSNSGVLKSHRHGKAIDTAAHLFRFNEAPIGGQSPEFGGVEGAWHVDYNAIVGGKEDVRVVNDLFPSTYLGGWRPYKEPAVYLVMPISWPPSLPLDLGAFANATSASVYSLDPHFVLQAEEAMHSIFDAGWWKQLGQSDNTARLGSPTSGLLTSLLALALCKDVRLYGLPATRRGLTSEYHYYSSAASAEIGNANSLNDHKGFRAEKYMFRLLADNSDLESSDVAVVKGLHTRWQECKSANVSVDSVSIALPTLVPVDAWRRDFGS